MVARNDLIVSTVRINSKAIIHAWTSACFADAINRGANVTLNNLIVSIVNINSRVQVSDKTIDSFNC